MVILLRVVGELKVGTDSIPSPQPLSRRERSFLYLLEKLPLPRIFYKEMRI